MRKTYDIAGDLDTPVSAFMKLGTFQPRFLLESVEGGERVGRYSFIGFGDSVEYRLDSDALYLNGVRGEAPADRDALLASLRGALARVARPQPEIAHVPLAGGLVGYAAYDVVRWFEKLPTHASPVAGTPLMHYVAPRSMLVFDHLTRGIAVLHAGPESERESLRREIVRALRGGLPNGAARGSHGVPTPSLSRADYVERVRQAKEAIAAGDVYQLVLSAKFAGRHDLDPFQVYRALRLINPSPYLYYCRLGEHTVVGSSPEALVKLQEGQAQLRPIAGTRPRAEDPAIDAAHEAHCAPIPRKMRST